MIEKVVFLVVSLRGLFTFVHVYNCRNPEKVIDIVLLRVLAFYLTAIQETGPSMLLLTRVKNTGRALNWIPWNIIFRRRNLLLQVLRRRKLALYCFLENVHPNSQDNKTGALVFWKELVHNCSPEKKINALIFQKKGSGTIPKLLVNNDESRQLIFVTFGKKFGFGLYLDKT